MKKRLATASFIVMAVALAAAVPARAGWLSQVKTRLGLGTEVFSRSLKDDANAGSAKLSGTAFLLTSEFRFPGRFDLNVFAGLGLPKFNGLVFDNLPFSLEYQGGAVAGFLIGGEIRKKIVEFGDFEIGAASRFVFSFGSNKTWPMTGFAEEGQAGGKPRWSEISLGPTLTYTGYERISPYLNVSLDRLSGTFRMAETMGELEGVESKSIKGQGLVRVSFGAFYEASARLGLRAEAAVIPKKGGVDTGVSLRIFYVF